MPAERLTQSQFRYTIIGTLFLTEGVFSLNLFKLQKARGTAARLFNRLFEERKIYSSLVSAE